MHNLKTLHRFSINFFIILCYIVVFSMNVCFGQNYINLDTSKVPAINKEFTHFEVYDQKNNTFFNDTISKYVARKFVILDFFSSGCAACFKSFTKLNYFQSKYDYVLQFIQIGNEDKNIKKYYDIYSKVISSHVPVVFDSVFCSRMVPYGYPHLIWIDNKGMVKAITSSEAMTENNIIKFINGKEFKYYNRSHDAYLNRRKENNMHKFDWSFYLDKDGKTLLRTDQDTNLLYKSEYGVWKPSMSFRNFAIVRSGPNSDRAIDGVGNLADLYRFAYLGSTNLALSEFNNVDTTNNKYYSFAPEIELINIDSLKFFAPFGSDSAYFWFRIIDRYSADMTDSCLLNIMKIELKKIFGFDVKYIKKSVKYFALTKASNFDQNLLKAYKEKQRFLADEVNFTATNYPFDKSVNFLLKFYLGKSWQDLYFNETNLNFNSNIVLYGPLLDKNSFVKELGNYGLCITQKQKDMWVLQISKK